MTVLSTPLDRAMALMDRYYRHEYTFNEVPHKSLWPTTFDQRDWQRAVEPLARAGQRQPQLLFINIPFCRRQCLFCICYTTITSSQARVRAYLDDVIAELDCMESLWPGRLGSPAVREIHLGGGSPTLLEPDGFRRLLAAVDRFSPLAAVRSFAIEVDPRGVDADRLAFYADCGVTRLSFGVQDFDPEVQRAIGRIQPVALLDDLLQPSLRERFEGINFDVLCGLPHQRPASFRRTIDWVLRFAPDRLMLMFLNYRPDLRPHQRAIDPDWLPSRSVKWAMFQEATDRLLEAGYVRIGFDHFARPTDSLARAQAQGRLHWNSLGYRAGDCVDMIGVGAGSLSRLTERVYAQNTCDLDQYHRDVQARRLPLARGVWLTDEDRLRRDVIHQLRCYHRLDVVTLEQRYGIDFSTVFAREIQALRTAERDGLVCWQDRDLVITELGRVFTASLCGLFDATLETSFD